MIADSSAGSWRQALRRREHALLLAVLAALTAAAWLLTLYQARTMDMSMGIVARDPSSDGAMGDMPGMAMAGEAGGGWRPGDLAIFLAVWAVMMTAMMLPAITPMLLLYRKVSGQRGSGARGALRMGIAHGVYCIGCCWALFAILVATGVMSIAWMLLLTLIVFVEKIVPVHPRLPQAIGWGFLLLGGAGVLSGIAST